MTAALSAPTTVEIPGIGTVRRIGLGTARLAGPGNWGPPRDRREAVAVLRSAVELGVDFIDTADSYGPGEVEPLIAEALHPYPEGLVLATKAGMVRPGPGRWAPLGRPAYLRQQVELSLRRLRVEALDVFHLHRVDPQVPFADQIEVLGDLVREGKIRALGLSEVTVEQLDEARRNVPVASVENHYSLARRDGEAVVRYAEAHGMVFVPWFPIAKGELGGAGGPLDDISRRHGVSPSRIALAWLLHVSPAVLPIPGTAHVPHVADNVAALGEALTDEEVRLLTDSPPDIQVVSAG